MKRKSPRPRTRSPCPRRSKLHPREQLIEATWQARALTMRNSFHGGGQPSMPIDSPPPGSSSLGGVLLDLV